MEARWTADNSPRLPLLTIRLLRSLAVTVFVLLPAIALLLLVRRAGGATQQALSPAVMLTVAAASCLFAALGRLAWVTSTRRPLSVGDQLACAVPALGLLLLGAALALPATETRALLAFWGVVVLGELVAWGALSGRREPRTSPLRAAPRQTAGARGGPRALDPCPEQSVERIGASQRPPETTAARDGEDGSRELSDDAWPEGLLQQFTRTRTDPRTEVLSGVLRAEFQPGERQQTLHLAFSPPLPARPRVDVQQAEGPAAQVKAADIQTYGVRFDVRLSRASDASESVWIAVEAVCAQDDAGADTGR